MISGYFGSCCCKTEQIFLIFCIISMKTKWSKRGYLVQYLIYISTFLFGWELWEPSGFGSWEIWRITFLVLIQIGSHPPSFTLTFEFEQIQKVQSRALMEPLTFTWFPPKIINFAPFTKSYSKKYAFQMALTEVIFKWRVEDDPNSSDFSGTQSPDIQLTFSEIHGGNSAQKKKSEQEVEPPHGIFPEKIWIHSFYHHSEINLHWAFQPWVKHNRLFGCDFVQKMPFP